MAEVPPTKCCHLCNIKLHEAGKKSKRARGLVELHLIPESHQERVIGAGLYSADECVQARIETCYLCCKAVQNYFTEDERVKFLANSKALRNALLEIGWIK